MKNLTNEQIVKGNKLIAIFDNWINENDFYSKEIINGAYKHCHKDHLAYHYSYNWTMPVWVKVFNFKITYYKDIKTSIDCGINNGVVYICLPEDILANKYIFITEYSLSEYDLNSALFLAIVDFLKWYNQNKEVIK